MVIFLHRCVPQLALGVLMVAALASLWWPFTQHAVVGFQLGDARVSEARQYLDDPARNDALFWL